MKAPSAALIISASVLLLLAVGITFHWFSDQFIIGFGLGFAFMRILMLVWPKSKE